MTICFALVLSLDQQLELSKPPDNSSDEQEDSPRTTTDSCHVRNESISTTKRKSIDSEDIDNKNLHKRLLNIIEGFSTPDLNEMRSDSNEEIIISLNEEPSFTVSIADESLPTLTDEIVAQAVESIVTNISESVISKSIPPRMTTASPTHQNPVDTTNIFSDECLIIVPCSDDELDNDDDDDFFLNTINSNMIIKESDIQIDDPSPLPPPLPLPAPIPSSTSITVVSPLRNPSLTRSLFS